MKVNRKSLMETLNQARSDLELAYNYLEAVEFNEVDNIHDAERRDIRAMCEVYNLIGTGAVNASSSKHLTGIDHTNYKDLSQT